MVGLEDQLGELIALPRLNSWMKMEGGRKARRGKGARRKGEGPPIV